MQSLALVIHVILAVGVIGLVLIQHGKGADAGAAFGSGASATVFGARGATSFLTRATTIGAAAFFATSLFLFYLAAHREGDVRSVTDVPGLVDEAPLVPAPASEDGDLPGVIAPTGDVETDVVVPGEAQAAPTPDASIEAPAEPVADTPTDTQSDTPPDAPVEAPSEAPSEAPPSDTPSDTPVDTPVEPVPAQ